MSEGIREDKCQKCGKKRYRKGFLCKDCYYEGLVRANELAKRANKKRYHDFAKIKKSLHAEILKKVIKKLALEENKK